MDQQDFYKQLITRYVAGQATEEELEAYFHLLETGEIDDALTAYLDEEVARMAEEETELRPAHLRRGLWPRIAAAASIILVLSVGSYFIWHKVHIRPETVQNQLNDIAPGSNKAILTLAGGKQIILTKTTSGQLSRQGNSTVGINTPGALAYTAGEEQDDQTAPVYNTLTTARKEQYQLVLGDGTKAWLNSASSITYPVAFNGKDRTVSVTGEVYFEVAHKADQPFKVNYAGQTVEDIGTEFDINAYADEPFIKTTLLKGNIRVIKGDQHPVLVPGQQAETQSGNSDLKIKQVNTEAATAWKNGYFYFSDEDIHTVMRKVARWYDVDVIYPEGQYISTTFSGSATRSQNVSQLLKMLEVTGELRFKIEGRKIYVSKK